MPPKKIKKKEYWPRNLGHNIFKFVTIMKYLISFALFIPCFIYGANTIFIDASLKGIGIGYEIPFSSVFIFHFGSINSIGYIHYDQDHYTNNKFLTIDSYDIVNDSTLDSNFVSATSDTIKYIEVQHVVNGSIKPYVGLGLKLHLNSNLIFLSSVDLFETNNFEIYSTYRDSNLDGWVHSYFGGIRLSLGLIILKLPIGISLDMTLFDQSNKFNDFEIVPRLLVYF